MVPPARPDEGPKGAQLGPLKSLMGPPKGLNGPPKGPKGHPRVMCSVTIVIFDHVSDYSEILGNGNGNGQWPHLNYHHHFAPKMLSSSMSEHSK
jgi:hypothetical protein